MFSSSFIEEQKMIKYPASYFAEKEIKPFASDLDRNSMFPAEFVERLFDLEFMRNICTRKYGGSGLDYCLI